MMWLYIIIGVVIVAFVVWFIRHQRKLRLRAYLMQEAIRNRDFTFRMPTDGMFFGERAMQETLNQLGGIIRQQVNQSEVESWERLTRVLTHEMMNATAPITSISQSLLSRPDVKGTPLEEGIHAIFTTSQHMNAFVNSYRKLSQLQQPVFEDVQLSALLTDIQQLYPNVTWDNAIPDDAVIRADLSMRRQEFVGRLNNHVGAQVIADIRFN